jgi:predicted nucleotidyltransferase
VSQLINRDTTFSELIEPKLDELAVLCRRLGVRHLHLFGSAATGRFDPARSDLDFLVEFEPAPLGGRYARAVFELRTGLERLFGRQIDLLTTSMLENPYLRHEVESEKRSLYPSQ